MEEGEEDEGTRLKKKASLVSLFLFTNGTLATPSITITSSSRDVRKDAGRRKGWKSYFSRNDAIKKKRKEQALKEGKAREREGDELE